VLAAPRQVRLQPFAAVRPQEFFMASRSDCVSREPSNNNGLAQFGRAQNNAGAEQDTTSEQSQ
jgi:hypothetical protein